MKRTVLLVSIFLSPVVLVESAAADMCTLDMVPAATLLLPYFEVDLDDPLGVTTLFSINNASQKPALVHLIFWTDWAVPSMDFDVYLTGYDVVTVDLREVFDGYVPLTADAPNDPDQSGTACGTKSPCGGTFSQHRAWDDTQPSIAGEQGFPYCDQLLPYYGNPAITGSARDRLVLGHTGQMIPANGGCIGSDQGDNVARGYLTIDNVSECSLVIDPANTGISGKPYFVDGGTGVANDENQLWGEFFFWDPANDSTSIHPLVHIEADPSFDADATPTGSTFYGRYLYGSGSDNREPLGTTWGARYFSGGAFSQTEFIVWRDTTSEDILPYGLYCGLRPLWHPLEETEVLCFDESEDAVELCSGPSKPACFPQATQKVPSSGLEIPFSSGWCYLNLNNACPTCEPGGFGPDGDIAQSYLMTIYSTSGRHAGGLPMVELAHACDGLNPPGLFDRVFADGFESGDTSLWSAAAAR